VDAISQFQLIKLKRSKRWDNIFQHTALRVGVSVGRRNEHKIEGQKNLKGMTKMKNIDLAKMICNALEKAEKESRGNIYILTPTTMQKSKQIEHALRATNYAISFDRVTNSLIISVKGYVFDSCVTELKKVFSIVDLFVIDALSNGQVCIEMKVLNAAEILRRS